MAEDKPLALTLICCRIKRRAGAKSSRSLRSDPMARATVRSDDARDTGLADKPVWTQVDGAQLKDLIDC